MKADPRVDQYIAKAPEFARPILTEVRSRVQRACPEATETIKWNVPFYVLGSKLVASMAAFKKHTKVGVWTDMKPNMRDVTEVEQLPAVKAFAQELEAAFASAAGAAPGKAKPSQGAAAKKAPARKAVSSPVVKKAPATKPTAKKATARKKPSKKK